MDPSRSPTKKSRTRILRRNAGGSPAPTRSVRRCSGCRQSRSERAPPSDLRRCSPLSERAARGSPPAAHPNWSAREHSGLPGCTGTRRASSRTLVYRGAGGTCVRRPCGPSTTSSKGGDAGNKQSSPVRRWLHARRPRPPPGTQPTSLTCNTQRPAFQERKGTDHEHAHRPDAGKEASRSHTGG